MELFKDMNAIITNSHVVYTSGKHGTTYINKDAIYLQPVVVSELCGKIAKHFKNYDIQAVIAPAVGGVILSTWVAYHFQRLTGRKVYSTYADKWENTFIIKRGYDKVIADRNVLVVEDILNTGGSVKKVVGVVKSNKGRVVGVGALCNRNMVTPDDIGVNELHSLINIRLEMWDEKQCPLCQQGVLINTEVGKGKEYLIDRGRTL